MSKTIKSPVKEFPGTVDLHDPLTMPMVVAFEKAIDETIALGEARQSEIDYTALPGIFACVKFWNLPALSSAINC